MKAFAQMFRWQPAPHPHPHSPAPHPCRLSLPSRDSKATEKLNFRELFWSWLSAFQCSSSFLIGLVPWDCSNKLPLVGLKHYTLVSLLCVCVSCSVVSDSTTPWTVARQAPLSMGFARWEYWRGLPFPSPATQGSSQPRDQNWVSCIAGRFFTIWAIVHNYIS